MPQADGDGADETTSPRDRGREWDSTSGMATRVITCWP